MKLAIEALHMILCEEMIHLTITITILFQVKIPQCVQLTLQLRYCKKNLY